MKNSRTNKFLLASALFSMLTLISCDNDSASSSPAGTNASAVTTLATAGTWHISYFYDTDHEETNNFTGYNFTFGNSNALTATNGTNTYTGNWSVADDNSNDDSSTDVDFNIGFSAPANFTDLSEDWDIVQSTATVITLKHTSGGNGGTDFLTFTKN